MAISDVRSHLCNEHSAVVQYSVFSAVTESESGQKNVFGRGKEEELSWIDGVCA